jgi:hypothetical protein
VERKKNTRISQVGLLTDQVTAYLESGDFHQGFARVRCSDCMSISSPSVAEVAGSRSLVPRLSPIMS